MVPDESRSRRVSWGMVTSVGRCWVVPDREVIDSNLCFKPVFWLLCGEQTGWGGAEVGRNGSRDWKQGDQIQRVLSLTR